MTSRPWKGVELGSLTSGEGGLLTGPFGSQLRASEYVAEGIPVVMPKDLVGGGISTRRIARVSTEKAAELDRYRLREGDVVVARRGEMGRSARVTAAEEEWVCGTGCLRIRVSDRVDPLYLAQVMQRPRTAAWLRDHAVGQTMPSLNTAILSALPVPCPPLAEQRRIASVLASVDQTIGAARSVYEQARRVLRHALIRLLGNRGRDATSRGSGDVARFRERSVSELCTMKGGHAFKAREWSDTGLPIIRIQNLNGSRDFNFYAGRARQEWIVETGDLLFAWAGGKRTSLGPRVWSGPRGVLNQHIFRVEPRPGVVKTWLFEALNFATREIEDRAQGFKASLVHVRKADILRQQVPVPTREHQRWIAHRSRALRSTVDAAGSSVEGLERLKLALLQSLF